MQNDLRRAAAHPYHLYFRPRDAVDPCAKRLHDRFLGGKSTCELRRPPACISLLFFCVAPAQEAFAVPLEDQSDAFNLDQVDACVDHGSPVRYRMHKCASARIVTLSPHR